MWRHLNVWRHWTDHCSRNPREKFLPLNCLPAPYTPQRARTSGLKVHFPPFRRRVDSFDEKNQHRLIWQPRRHHLKFYKAYYEKVEDAETEPPSRRKKIRRRVKTFIYAKARVDGDASGDKITDEEYNNQDKLIVADDV